MHTMRWDILLNILSITLTKATTSSFIGRTKHQNVQTTVPA